MGASVMNGARWTLVARVRRAGRLEFNRCVWRTSLYSPSMVDGAAQGVERREGPQLIGIEVANRDAGVAIYRAASIHEQRTRFAGMMPISDVHVSFDVHSANGTTLVVPYVVAPQDLKLAYDLKVLKIGSSGQSTASQSGNLAIHAGERRAITRLVMNLRRGDSCNASLALNQPGGAAKTDTFDCSLK